MDGNKKHSPHSPGNREMVLLDSPGKAPALPSDVAQARLRQGRSTAPGGRKPGKPKVLPEF